MRSLVSKKCAKKGAESTYADYIVARLKLKWNAAVYAFYRPEIEIVYDGGRRGHQFHCAGPSSKA